MENSAYKVKALSSLKKVFSDQEPRYEPESMVLTALKNETVSFQVAYSSDLHYITYGRVRVDSPIEGNIRIRQVIEVPSSLCCHPKVDDNYLRTKPGLYPDLLRDLDSQGTIRYVAGQWQSLWIDVDITEDLPAGTYPIIIKFFDHEDTEVSRVEVPITVFDAVLPEQELIRTEWFHGDCLADYYGIDVFSPEHWEILENFIETAVRRGINMILTPQFTPPLDTAVGGQRTTIQLVDVIVENGKYSFDFTKLEKWVDICQRVGVRYIEMSHLFTQWGAKAAPKVMARIDGEYKQIFGWDTPAVGGEYTRFLNAYLPQLTSKLKDWGIADRTYFHISDEPTINHLESYNAAKESVAEHLKGFAIIDALSDYEFYKTGAVEKPISSNNHIHTFLDHGVENMWSYYCTSQFYKVSNRFMSMPSARNRIYGVQLYKYDIEGVLHWGYNFYNSQYSIKHINPYVVTDAMGAFPSGDSFLVYPGEGGSPEESIRMMVHYHAMTDLRALKLLESLTTKEYVMELIEGDLAEPLTFHNYPKSDLYLISLRNRVNREIAKRI